MAITAGNALSKISEIRSKIAIFEGLIMYLRANYVSSDAGEAEMRFTRSDYATVPEKHVEVSVHELQEQIENMQRELEEWESLELDVAPAEPPPRMSVAQIVLEETVRRSKKSKEAANGEADGEREDQPPAGRAARSGNG